MNKIKEYHLHLDNSCIDYYEGVTYNDEFLYYTYKETAQAIQAMFKGEDETDVVHSTQMWFLNFMIAERLFVHVNGEEHEITLGECEGTSRYIRKENDLPRLLMCGEFDWFQ